MSTETVSNFNLVLQADGPGRGQSSARKNLANYLEAAGYSVRQLYAGMIFRGLAREWFDLINNENNIGLDKKSIWKNGFYPSIEQKYNLLIEGDPSFDEVDYLSIPEYGEEVLKGFEQDIKDLGEGTSLIDEYVDLLSIKAIVSSDANEVVVVEGKNALASWHIDRFAALIGQIDKPTIKVLFTCSWFEAARRITKRRVEKSELPESLGFIAKNLSVFRTLNTIYKRHQLLRERLIDIYGVDPDIVAKDEDVVTIDTTDLSEEQVTLEVLKVIANKISGFSHTLLGGILNSHVGENGLPVTLNS